MLACAVGRNDAGVFLRDLAVASRRAFNWHGTTALYSTKRRQFKGIASQWQVRVPAGLGDEVFPLGGFMSCRKEPAEFGLAVVDFGQVPAICGLGIQGTEYGIGATRDLAIDRPQGRETFGGLAYGLWLILGLAAVGVQPQLAGIGTGWR